MQDLYNRSKRDFRTLDLEIKDYTCDLNNPKSIPVNKKDNMNLEN